MRRKVLRALLIYSVFGISSAAPAQTPSPQPHASAATLQATYEVRGLPPGWELSSLHPAQLTWDDFGDRYRWVSGSSSLVLVRGLGATSGCRGEYNKSERVRVAKRLNAVAIRSSVNVRGFRNGKSTVETVAFVRPAARTNTVDFLETVAASPNDPWTKATRAAALIDCKNGILLVGTNGFASLDVLRKRWFDPDDGRRLLLVNYEAPNDPTLFPNQSFSRPDGPTLRVTVAKDPRTTLGVSFGAASTVPVLGAIARELNGTISFVPCRGTLVSLASDDLSGAELAAIANLIKIAFPVGTVPAFEYGQVDDPCPVWRK